MLVEPLRRDRVEGRERREATEPRLAHREAEHDEQQHRRECHRDVPSHVDARAVAHRRRPPRRGEAQRDVHHEPLPRLQRVHAPGPREIRTRAPGGVEREREIEALDPSIAVDHREVVIEHEAAVRLRQQHAAVERLYQIFAQRVVERRIARQARTPAERLAVVAPCELVHFIHVVVGAEFGLGARRRVDAHEPLQRDRLREAHVPAPLGAVPVAREPDRLPLGEVQHAGGVEARGDGDGGPVDAAGLGECGAGEEQQREGERADGGRHAAEGGAAWTSGQILADVRSDITSARW